MKALRVFPVVLLLLSSCVISERTAEKKEGADVLFLEELRAKGIDDKVINNLIAVSQKRFEFLLREFEKELFADDKMREMGYGQEEIDQAKMASVMAGAAPFGILQSRANDPNFYDAEGGLIRDAGEVVAEMKRCLRNHKDYGNTALMRYTYFMNQKLVTQKSWETSGTCEWGKIKDASVMYIKKNASENEYYTTVTCPGLINDVTIAFPFKNRYQAERFHVLILRMNEINSSPQGEK